MKTLLYCFLSLSFTFGLSQEKLQVGIVLYKSQEKVEQTFQPMMDYVASKMDREAEIHIVHEDDLAYYLEDGTYDIGIFTVFPYLKEKADFPDLKVFATHHVNGKDHFYGTILASKESGIENWQELVGKRFRFVKPTSTSGFKYPKGVLEEHSIDVDHGALEYDFAGGHEEAIRALLSNEVDAIAVDETRLGKIEGISKDQFIELERFRVPYHAYVMSPKLDTAVSKKIASIFGGAHRDPATRALWDNPLGITRWELKKDEYYNVIRRYLRIIRVQPEVDINITSTDNAKKKLEVLGDVKTVMERRIRRYLAESNRFSNKHTHTAEYAINLDLAVTGDHFSYQVKINDEYITDGEVYPDSINTTIPRVTALSLLKKAVINTNLLFNGEEWFITYGFNDGLNLEDYEFSIMDKRGRRIPIADTEIDKIDELNIFFNEDDQFYKDAPVQIQYGKEIKVEFEEDVTDIGTYNIFSRNFWNQNYWDKLGLIGGIVVAIISAIIGKVVSDRKKKRFKNILYQTNNLIKEYVDGHYKLEAKLIDQKEKISEALEQGHINENQFLILKQRIEDMQNIVEIHHQGDVSITDNDANEISRMVKDGTVTEKDFSRIMSILSKSKPVNS